MIFHKQPNIIFFYFILLFLMSIQTSFADKPFVTDNPETLLPHQDNFLIYSSYNQFKGGKTLLAPAFEYDFALFEDLEIDTFLPLTHVFDSQGLPGGHVINSPVTHNMSHIANASGIGDLGMELKCRFLHETTRQPQVAFAPNFFLPTGNAERGLGNGRFFWYPAFTFQKSFGKWLIYATSGYVFNGAPDVKNYLFGGLVAQREINDRLSLGAELFSQGRSSLFFSPTTLLNVGTQFTLENKCTFYFSLGKSLVGENFLISYLGLGWG